VPVLRPVGVQACRAARAGVTVVGAGWRQLHRGLTTLAPRRKPGRGSMVPIGCEACGRLAPCLAGVYDVVGTGLPRVIVLANRSRPSGIACVGALHRDVGNRQVEDTVSVGERPVGAAWPAAARKGGKAGKASSEGEEPVGAGGKPGG